GSGRGDAARSDGDATLLWLQFRRLLATLAHSRREAHPAAAHLSRQLVPSRCPGQVPVARIWGKPAGADLDAGALRRPRRRNRDRHRQSAPAAGPEHPGPVASAPGGAAAPFRGPGAVAQGTRRDPRLPGQIRRPRAGGAVGRVEEHAAAARLSRVRPGASGLFAIETDGLRGALLRQTSETDHPLPLDLQAVAPHERFFAVGALHEGAVRALIDQHELVAIDLDARMQARDEAAL